MPAPPNPNSTYEQRVQERIAIALERIARILDKWFDDYTRPAR